MRAGILDRPAHRLVPDLQSGALTASELARASLARIDTLESEIHAWACIDHELILELASEADARRERGEPLGPLHGVPIGIKDMIDTADLPTEYGTPIHGGRRPMVDATLVSRLRAAGAIIMGKTVLSEHAVYSPGPTRNPRDLDRTPGGSSSGSAAAVAAGMVPWALGTQTNGSVIRPASFCGIVGYKPSLGLLPRTGILKQSALLDQPGVMARDVADVALLVEVLCGFDAADEQSLHRPAPKLFNAASRGGAQPRFAFVRSPYWQKLDIRAREALEGFVSSLGTPVEVLELPPQFGIAADVHAVIMNAGIAEAYAGDYSHSKHLMADLLVGIIEHGRNLSAVEFLDAVAARERLRFEFSRLAAPYDAIITPAALGIAPKFKDGTGNPIMATIWTLLGAPALTLPLLTGEEGMPLGVQLVGNLLGDGSLIAAASWLERRARLKILRPAGADDAHSAA